MAHTYVCVKSVKMWSEKIRNEIMGERKVKKVSRFKGKMGK